MRVTSSHLDINYESVTFSGLITPTAGGLGSSTGPRGAILLTVSTAQGLELLLSSPLVRVAISVTGKCSHWDGGRALGRALLIAATFAESPHPSVKREVIASFCFSFQMEPEGN